MFSYRRLKGIRLISVIFVVLVGLLGLSVPGETRQLLIRNAALIVTMDPEMGEGPLGVIEDGDVLVDEDTISAIGKNLTGHHGRVLDVKGKIVLPGFIDVHNHLWQSLIRGCGTDKDVIGWLDACVFPVYDIGVSEEEAYAGVRLSTLDIISTGVTTVVDWSHAFSPEFVRGNIQALSDSGLRFGFAYYGSKDDDVIEDIRRVKEELIDPNPRAIFQVASHPSMDEPFLDNLIAMSGLARELGVKLHVHLLENVKQRADEPIKALKQADALGPNLVCAHAVHLTDEEIAILAENDVRVAHNPLSNMRLASGIMRLSELHAEGLKVGLGLDGGCNDTSDMFNSMRVSVGLQRATSLRAQVFPSVVDVLRMATTGAAELLDMSDQIGSLTPGKKADLIILDPGGVNFAPRFDWISQLVFNGQPTNVEWVFVDGRQLKARGRFVGIRPDVVVQAAQAAADRIREALADACACSSSARPETLEDSDMVGLFTED